MRLALLVVLLSVSLEARADQWSFFYPEYVTSITCKVQEVQFEVYGSGHSEDAWMAEAFATRSREGDWSTTLGRFEPNDKGFDKAIKACRVWTHEAEKRMRKAQAK